MGVLWLRSLDEVLDAALASGWTPSHTDLTVTLMLGGIYGDVRAAVKWLASPAMQGCAQPEVALHRALLRPATSHRSISLTLPCTTANYPSPLPAMPRLFMSVVLGTNHGCCVRIVVVLLVLVAVQVRAVEAAFRHVLPKAHPFKVTTTNLGALSTRECVRVCPCVPVCVCTCVNVCMCFCV